MEQEAAIYHAGSEQVDLSIPRFWASQSHLMTKAKRRQETRVTAAHITEALNHIYAIQPSRLSKFWQRLQFQKLSCKW